tara:strand:+ start:15306 stop:15629 length:324 start_codon:yes stop_codon:yes gene_type:complete
MSDERREWHLEKSVSVGHIVTTFVVAAGAVAYFSALEGRINSVAMDVDRQSKAIMRIEDQQKVQDGWITTKLEAIRKEQNEMRVEQKRDNQRIEDKIDRLIERELLK